MNKEKYPLPNGCKDNIDQFIWDTMRILPGSCSSMETLRYNIARETIENLLKALHPTDEQIVNAAKAKGQEKAPECFCELVHSPKSRGANSAFEIGFIEGAVWCRNFFIKLLKFNETR